MIEPLRPEIESAQRMTGPGPAKEKAPQNGDGARINLPTRPVNRAFPKSMVTTAQAADSTLKDTSPTRRSAETARISVFTDFAKIPALPPVSDRKPKVTQNQSIMDTIPKSLCWALLGSSIAILLIEIWNYIN
ncbi:MAG TPA: hypothetical protein VGH08_08315 [Chthoniobacterales bacterium]|jgi:hypothetical protein